VNYPYVYSLAALKRFLNLIPETGTPAKLTPEYLKTAGFRNTNDRAIISVLKFVNLLADDGTPTSDYSLLRDNSKAGAVMSSHLKTAYKELFDLYPDANNQPDEKLKNFFAPQTPAGGESVNKIVGTFKTLCESADFGAAPISSTTTGQGPSQVRVVSQTIPSSEGGVTINLNIQLQLPPTENAEIYDKIFESLKKHLIDLKPAANA